MSEMLIGVIVGGIAANVGHMIYNVFKHNTQTQNVGNSSIGVQMGGKAADSVVKTLKDEIFNITGDNIIANNSKIIVDGKVIFDNTNQTHKVTIIVEGDCETVKTSLGEVDVKGTAGSVTTSLGDVHIGGAVTGHVDTTLGNVTVLNGNIMGSVKTTLGDVRCK